MSIWDMGDHKSNDWNYTLERAEKIGRDTVSMIFAAFCCGVVVGVVIASSVIISYASGG